MTLGLLRFCIRPYLGYGIGMRFRVRPCLGHGFENETSHKTISGIWHCHLTMCMRFPGYPLVFQVV
ncbi:TUB-B: Tubulin beta chain [Gossypium arboreum]|uniref:TUB-B: Tubulin beta chain n=1 Tax=Gossypium arboreum TaxID=29729 RepID=A0A0B0NVR1_GOSAR|nr:TUB-B: Tubulin beta chain [Gossypium arboreum]KHG15182.1 TUB-B: Tubulin beta chain [Gossypium arboreum]